jgi:hypothetical protein
MTSGRTTVTVNGVGTFEIPTERLNEIISLLRAMSACKVNCAPVMEQGSWNGQVLLNG